MLVKTDQNIDNELIDEVKLSSLNFYILALKYLERVVSYYTKLATKNKDERENKHEKLPISNSKKKIKKLIIKREKKKPSCCSFYYLLFSWSISYALVFQC